jgi:hypothetical protein
LLVTNSTGNTSAQPGWYDDPAGSGRKRWWDGTQWTEHVVDPAVPQQTVAAAPVPIPGVPAGTPVYNFFIWAVAVMYVLPLIAFLFFDFDGYMQKAMTGAESGSPYGGLDAVLDPGYLLLIFSGLLAYALTVVFAYFDWRTLKRAGFIEPFHWAWAFLYSGVYVIGRSIVVKRRAGHGLAPIWAWVGVLAVYIIVSLIKGFTAVFDSMQSIPIPGYNS